MDTLYKFELRRMRLNRKGYDEYGRYFGIGQPLYRYAGKVEGVGEDGMPVALTVRGKYIRANSREDAKAQVKALYPKARFYN